MSWSEPDQSQAGLTDELRGLIRAEAARIGANAEDLEALIRFETGGKFSTKVVNPSSGATGLIQFMPSTARKLGTTTAALARMSHAEQFAHVSHYFDRVIAGKWEGPAGNLHTTQALFMAVFYPEYRYVEPHARFPAGVIAANPGIETPADYVRKVQSYHAS